MKNLQINDSPIGAQEYPLAEKVSEDIYIYNGALRFTGYSSMVIISFKDITNSSRTVVPNLPSLENEIYLFIQPNPDTSYPNRKHYSWGFHKSSNAWLLNDTGYKYLSFNFNTGYRIYGSTKIFTDDTDVSSLATPIAEFKISSKKDMRLNLLYTSWVSGDGTISKLNSVSSTGTTPLTVYLNNID